MIKIRNNCELTMRRKLQVLLFAALCGAFFGPPARTFAESGTKPLLHPLFCDHAVLQRDVAVPVWGWTQPKAKVAVSFGGRTQTAVAGTDGKWSVTLKPMHASAEPRTLTVTSSAEGQSATAEDILVGDVWLCSGQSNMEMGVDLCNVTNDIATADFPRMRLLTVPHHIA